METIQQGRLWAIRNGPSSPIFHVAETGLPTLFRTRKDADSFKKRIKAELDTDVEVVEVQIIEVM